MPCDGDGRPGHARPAALRDRDRSAPGARRGVRAERARCRKAAQLAALGEVQLPANQRAGKKREINWKSTANAHEKPFPRHCGAFRRRAFHAAAQARNRESDDAYRLVQTRHIFDPNRRAPGSNPSDAARDHSTESFELPRPNRHDGHGFQGARVSLAARVPNTPGWFPSAIPSRTGRVTAISVQDVDLRARRKFVVLVIGGAPLSLDGAPTSERPRTEHHPPATSTNRRPRVPFAGCRCGDATRPRRFH